jgi:branched-chain amino acid transport system permease protein
VFTLPLAGLVTGLIGVAFGIPALRLAGVSLALATFAVAVSLPILARRFDELTGGGGGLILPLPSTPFGWDISTRHWLYYEAWVTAGILFIVAWVLVRGRIGRAWRSIRDGEIAAVSSGVSPALYKVLAFGVSSFYAGVAGALLAIEVSFVNPDTFPLSLSVLLLASAVLGGLGALSGVIFGALLLEYLPIYSQDPPVVSWEFATQAPAVVFGAFLIVFMLLLPGGVAGLFRRIGALLQWALGGRRTPEEALAATPVESED